MNQILKPFRVQLRTLGDPNREFSEFIGHLGTLGIQFQTVIDVGVAFGTHALYAAIPKAKFFLIEPVPSCAPIMANIAKRVNAVCFNVAAGAHDGELDFNVHDDVSGSSALRQVEGVKFDGQSTTVPVRRLDSLIADAPERPCLLKIDTQGFEIAVIDGAEKLLSHVDVVIIECSFHKFRHNAPEIFDVMARMDQLGFVPYETLEGHYRIVENALAQVDVAFVPRDSALRRVQGMFPE